MEDVYDRIEESDYVKLVEKRRSANNFVVDDSEFCNFSRSTYARNASNVKITSQLKLSDGMGYDDDGEEHIGVEDDVLDG